MANNSLYRLGNPLSYNSAIGPPNQGLGRYAQARLDTTVARAVRRHAEALRVDGVPLHLWVKRNGGLICTCRAPAKPIAAEQTLPAERTINTDEARQSRQEQFTPEQDADTEVKFQIIHVRGRHALNMPNTTIPPEFAGVTAPESNLDGSPQEHLAALAPDGTVDADLSDTELARILSQGGAVYGGDQTPCGICYSTGRTHGYEYFSGKRLVLDASNEWPFTLNGSANIDYQQHPAKFNINSSTNSTVEWLVDLPAFTNGWLVLAARDNLKPANNLQIQWFIAGTWQPLTIDLLMASEGTQRTAQRIRVISTGLGLDDQSQFTHVELTYSTAPPVLAQMGPLPATTNFDINEPELSIEFEILASVDSIPRESVFQDSKFKMCWKVTDVTQKLTAQGQIFLYTVTARNVHQGEPILAMNLLFNAAFTVNYRGNERSEGSVTQEYWPESRNIPNDFVVPEDDPDQYDTDLP